MQTLSPTLNSSRGQNLTYVESPGSHSSECHRNIKGIRKALIDIDAGEVVQAGHDDGVSVEEEMDARGVARGAEEGSGGEGYVLAVQVHCKEVIVCMPRGQKMKERKQQKLRRRSRRG